MTESLSQSRLRAALACGEQFRLRSIAKVPGESWPGSLLGQAAHAMIKLRYLGDDGQAALDTVWSAIVGDDHAAALREYGDLADQYAASGGSRTKAAKEWREQHPRYDSLSHELDRLGTERLPHIRWNRDGLSSLYLRARRMSQLPDEQLLFRRPLLLEGQPVWEATRTLDIDAVPGAERDYHPISAMRHGIPLTGVPDVVADNIAWDEPDPYEDDSLDDAGLAAELHRRGVILGDLKTGRTQTTTPHDLREDGQLALYHWLCLETGVFEPDTPVVWAHGNINQAGDRITWVYVPMTRNELEPRLERIDTQARAVQRMIQSGEFPHVKGLQPDTCARCPVSQHCRV
jgi:hypothetical protein